MLRTQSSYILVWSLIIFSSLPALAQDIRVEVGEGEIALNEAFTITVLVENDKLKNLSGFPEIAGMVKRGDGGGSRRRRSRRGRKR